MIRALSVTLAVLAVLPAGAQEGDDLWSDDAWETEEDASPWGGFLEAGLGTRLSDDPLVGQRETLQELRLRVERQWQLGGASLTLKADGGYDGVDARAFGELRDLSLAFRLGSRTDVNVGRQVLTWGTGDLLFLNDLFPKDFVSFFAGRDDEYLKAPGDTLRINHYTDAVNIDFAWTPVFEPDVYLTGERFSFLFPPAGMQIAPRPPFGALLPESDLDSGEFALRLHRTVAGREYAAYLYRGYFKQPNALTASLTPTFAPLAAVGASLRQGAGPGLFNLEFAWYESRDDSNGDDPFVPNSQLRLLAGYEWEARTRLTVGLQYYLEATMDHDALLANSPAPQFEPDEFRHVLTSRLTLRSERERFTWSLFAFASPSDRDFYLRPVLSYRHSDEWTFSAGANLFGGDAPQTFFNQLSDASNVYARLRFSY